MSTTDTKFTPGPWRWVGTKGNPNKKAYLAHAWDDLPNSWVGVALDGFTDNDADASLIAAAPELLAAVETLLMIIDTTNPAWREMQAITNARAAIAKAKGQP